MAELTKEEAKWVKQVNALLKKCPSKRLGFFTIGDREVFLYDITHQGEIDDNHGDLVLALNRTGYGFEESIYFPNQVQGVCG